MKHSDATSEGQKARDLKRKTQLREAQRRLRQRKNDALSDATSEIEALREQLAEAKEKITRLNLQKQSSDTDEMMTSKLSLQQIETGIFSEAGHEQISGDILDFPENVFEVDGLDQLMSPGTLQNLFPETPNDALQFDALEPTALSQVESRNKAYLLQDSLLELDPFAPDPTWTVSEDTFNMDYTTILEDGLPSPSRSTITQFALNPHQQLLQQPIPPPITSSHRLSFSKRLWRRCAELTLRNLSNMDKNKAAIERAFGNYFAHVSPSVVIKALSTGLRRDDYAKLEYHNYPNFQFGGQQSLEAQSQHVDHTATLGYSGFEQDSYMTPLDIENYFVWNGQMSQAIDDGGNVYTETCQFDFQGKRWILEEHRLMHTLVPFAVCLGQGPAILASQVITAVFQSMQRCMP